MSEFETSRRRVAFVLRLVIVGILGYFAYTYYQGMAEIAEPLVNDARIYMESKK